MSDDNLEPLITQCPNCDTRFRVTEAQLQVAAGRVRCGACLTVFEGTSYLIVDGESIAASTDDDLDAVLEELEEVGDQGRATAMPEIGEGDLAVVGEADMADEEAHVPEALAELEAQFLAELKGDTQNDSESDNETADDGQAVAADDPEIAPIVAEPLGVNVSESEVEPASLDEQTEALDAKVDDKVNAEADEKIDEKIDEKADEKTDEDIDDALDSDPSAWLENVAEEAWSDAPDAEATSEVEEFSSDEANSQEIDPGQIDPEEETPTAATPSDPGESLDGSSGDEPQVDHPPGLEVETPVLDYTAELEEIDEPQKRRSWWTLGIAVLLLIGMPLQVLWFQYDAWVKDPEIRPIYVSFCKLLDCELPPMRDLTQISSKRSFIRAHPERDDARIVDVLMVNNADFAQPYPLIELTATSLRGQLIAGRRFRPDEYLQGDAASAEMMPPRTPVHVSLEIQDPGEEAMNFEVKFR